jgi:hypothetical protein
MREILLAIGTTVCTVFVFTAPQPASALQPAALDSIPAVIVPIANPENEAVEESMSPDAMQPGSEGEAAPKAEEGKAEEKPMGSEDMEGKELEQDGMSGGPGQ